MANLTSAAQAIGIATAFAGAGGIATLSYIDIPILQSLPASRSLPQIRWLFSRGSHVYPTAGAVSAGAFVSLAYGALAQRPASVAQFFNGLMSGGKSSAYIAAALLCFGIGPYTNFVMVPTNFKLMDLNAEKGGQYSFKSAKAAKQKGKDTASDAPYGNKNTGEFTDISGPQPKTEQESTPAENQEVRELLGKFASMNYVRAVLMAAGGFVAVLAAITP